MPASRPPKPRKLTPPASPETASAEWDRVIVEAVERDQRRVAQALHDTICQSLTGIYLLARVTARRFTTECPAAAAEVMELGDELNQAVDEVRELVRLLLPTEIETGRLRVALRALASDISERVPCEVECEESLGPIDSQIGSQLYPIAKVAVDRALQVPGVSRIVITLRRAEGGIELAVCAETGNSDEPPLAMPTRLLGWELMRHRAHAIGATLATDFPDGTGTIVSCRVPTRRRRRNGAHAR